MGKQIVLEGAQVTLMTPFHVTRNTFTRTLVLGEVGAEWRNDATQMTGCAVLLMCFGHVSP